MNHKLISNYSLLLLFAVGLSCSAIAPEGECTTGDCQNGSGEMLYSNGALYVGAFRDGQPDGFGTLLEKDGRQYEGHFVDGHRDGTGYLRLSEGEFYHGQFSRNEYHGFGVLINGDVRYAGEWKQGLRDGAGMERRADRMYIGDFENDTFSGDGYVTLLEDGQSFADAHHHHGAFRNGVPHGAGISVSPDGRILIARWESGNPVHGLLRFPVPLGLPGDIYIGDFADNVPNGEGVAYYADGRRFHGTFQAGERWAGTLFLNDGSKEEVQAEGPAED